MMKKADLAERAALNNAAWCDVICGTHGAAGDFRETAWLASGPVPSYYPNMVTLTADAIEDELNFVDEIVASIGAEHSVGVKDSFARLDLSSRRFAPIIEAQWYALSTPPTSTSSTCIELVSDDEALIEWERAWSATSPNKDRIFKRELLEVHDVSFLAAREGGQIVAGVIANRAADAVGISNVFVQPRLARAFLTAALSTLNARFGDLPVIGYSGGTELEFMLGLGFKSVGPLKVWVRPMSGS